MWRLGLGVRVPYVDVDGEVEVFRRVTSGGVSFGGWGSVWAYLPLVPTRGGLCDKGLFWRRSCWRSFSVD